MRSIALTSALLALLALFAVSLNRSQASRQLQIQLQTQRQQYDNKSNSQPQPLNQLRPIMYTFFTVIYDHPFNKPAGMSHEAHHSLVELWKKSWWDAGWEPKILTEEDAERHPEYERLRAMVDNIDTGSYDKLCFLRWLAMSAAGGGWMGDYDVLPLHDFRTVDGFILPNDGALTIHNRLCPSLVSGVKSEWDRMAKRLIEYGLEKQLRTDQRTVVALYKKYPSIFKIDYSVTQHMFNTTTWSKLECDTYTPTTIRAAHFAHVPLTRAKAEGKLPASFTMDQRPMVATEWLEMWHKACGSKVFQGTGPLYRRLSTGDIALEERGTDGWHDLNSVSSNSITEPSRRQ